MSYEDPLHPAENAGQTATDSAAKAWETTRDKAGEALRTGERYVRDHPGTSTLSVFGIGFALGLLVGWAVAHESHEDYASQARKFGRRWGNKLHFN